VSEQRKFVPLMERDNILWVLVAAILLSIEIPYLFILELLYQVARLIVQLHDWAWDDSG
jgi:hypothetical protein